MSKLIRIPIQFYEDHYARALPTPDIVRDTKRHYYISSADPHLEELRSDAEYYADRFGPDAPWLKNSAKATLAAINKVVDEVAA